MNCDRIAPWYRWVEYAAFGRDLEKTRTQYLGLLSEARRVLVLGDGDGRFLAALVKQNLGAQIDAIDSSEEMLRLSAERLRRCCALSRQRVSLYHADVRTFPLMASSYDLIVTHFLLDCFTTEESLDLVARISCAASPQAQWVVSEFRHPRSGLGRLWAGFWIWASYLFFRFATGLSTKDLPDYSTALGENGFVRISCRMRSCGMLTAELWRRGAPGSE